MVAELLIVVAIIGVLVAISIPIFTSQLEKAREATDISNIRAAYAEVTADYLTNGGKSKTATVAARQKQSGWQNSQNGKLNARVNGVSVAISVPAKTTGNYTVSINKSGTVKVE